MEITQKNFKEKLPEFREIIDKASFFAIDGEFTGISHENSISQYDSPAEYYQKIVSNTSGYILIQFGITAFWVDPDDSNAFKSRSYNFFVYPRGKWQRFKCQGESMSFLGSHNFDFNKLFSEGIPFCDLAEANKLREKFEIKKKISFNEKKDEYSEQQLIEVPENEKQLLANVKNTVENFLLSGDKEKVIANCNPFQRRLIYQLLEQKYSDKIFASSRNLPNTTVKVIVIERTKSSEEEQQLFEEQLKKEQDEMEDFIGFTNFIKLLSDSKKLIIGHNMFLDVLYTMRQFIGPLPQTLKELKHSAHKMFPNFLDTKYLCSQDIFKTKITSNILAGLFDCVSHAPFSLPEIEADGAEYSYSIDTPKEHEAGYDSYLTGICFIAMALNLNIKPSEINEKSQKLKSYINKLFIMRLADICYINLTGKESDPSRSHVFHVTIPENWKQSNLVHHFRNYGGINISWIQPDGGAYVALHHREHAASVMKTISLVEGFSIQTLADYRAKKKPNTAVETPDVVSQVQKRKPSEELKEDDDETGGPPQSCASSDSSKKKKALGKKQRQKLKNRTTTAVTAFADNDNWS